jgi:hypothetical protein
MWQQAEPVGAAALEMRRLLPAHQRAALAAASYCPAALLVLESAVVC